MGHFEEDTVALVAVGLENSIGCLAEAFAKDTRIAVVAEGEGRRRCRLDGRRSVVVGETLMLRGVAHSRDGL